MIAQWLKPVAEFAALALETFGVLVIVASAALATVRAAVDALRRRDGVYGRFRTELSRGILLGLEFLVGADIVHTVAVDLTYASVGVLAVVVLIRTFLSFTLEVEMTGRWPWQHAPHDARR